MRFRVLCVGKLKEGFYRDACHEFCKRLSRYAQVEILEVPDEKAPEQLSPAQRSQVKEAEGQRLLAKVSEGDWVVALDIAGEPLSSPQLAQRLQQWNNQGKSRFAFLIGGSLGLSDAVLARADQRISFGPPTFSHQLFRVMLLEQLYRACKINAGEPYHKEPFGCPCPVVPFGVGGNPGGGGAAAGGHSPPARCRAAPGSGHVFMAGAIGPGHKNAAALAVLPGGLCGGRRRLAAGGPKAPRPAKQKSGARGPWPRAPLFQDASRPAAAPPPPGFPLTPKRQRKSQAFRPIQPRSVHHPEKGGSDREP